MGGTAATSPRVRLPDPFTDVDGTSGSARAVVRRADCAHKAHWHPMSPHLETVHELTLDWYAHHRRELPWRASGVDPWAVLVSEVMLQQTPVTRVEPVWRSWQRRWPAPADLAASTPADVLRAWGGLGYPRRALRLRDCARVIVDRHAGRVPDSLEDLRALPGVGEYTAAAVAAFAHRRRTVVLDTNVRRVLSRVLDGVALPRPTLTRAERTRAEGALPADAEASAAWNVAVMELGALVCTARAPRCGSCPLAEHCRWRAAGRPADPHAGRRRSQRWVGTDRQTRGRVMAVLRAAASGTAPVDAIAAVLPDADQRERVLASLRHDRLIESVPGGYRLPLDDGATAHGGTAAARRT